MDDPTGQQAVTLLNELIGQSWGAHLVDIPQHHRMLRKLPHQRAGDGPCRSQKPLRNGVGREHPTVPLNGTIGDGTAQDCLEGHQTESYSQSQGTAGKVV